MGSKRIRNSARWLGLICIVALAAPAGVLQAAAPTTQLTEEQLDDVARQVLGGGDAANASIKMIGEYVRSAPDFLAHHSRNWCQPLFEAKKYGQLTVFIEHVIVADPSDTEAIMDLQPYRARAFLYNGKWNQALFAAKGMYNVCTLDRMDKAQELMAKCLKDARSTDSHIVERFQAEQGAEPAQRENVATTKALTVLQSIPLDRVAANNYKFALAKLIGTDYQSFLKQGNLLLLADRVPDARKCFEAAYRIANENELSEATENLARVMKAEDGSPARAIAWLAEHHAPTTTPTERK